ncbi:hypothetical protein BDQ12DRAFT_127311 [Crucibulum laeve]|uniref:Uncharacterized protein n=1 Tax=Crucibulum laeve TaxID=68775 RepID=A0A5C3LZW8_9AGAR|nr:hypothetical protein BDQ12DRAFT_127311 [Crucibulum laeve]
MCLLLQVTFSVAEIFDFIATHLCRYLRLLHCQARCNVYYSIPRMCFHIIEHLCRHRRLYNVLDVSAMGEVYLVDDKVSKNRTTLKLFRMEDVWRHLINWSSQFQALLFRH